MLFIKTPFAKEYAMNRLVKFILISAALLMLSLPVIVFGQSTMTFNFQGKLNNSLGSPVPDGNYLMTFLIYADSVGGTPLWTESHPTVHVGSGFFGVDLGSTTPCSLSLASRATLYLAAQVGTEPPMAHRFRITNSPNAGVARRVYGDLQTSPGSIVLNGVETAQSSISLNTGSENMGIVIEERTAQRSIGLNNGAEHMGVVVEERPTDLVNGRSFHAGIDSGEVNLGMDGPNGQKMIAGTAKPGSLGRITWGLFNPQPEPPGHDNPVIQMSTGVGNKGSIYMFNPQPEPPGSDPNKLIEMSTGAGGEASWVMFNPQPEPPGSDPTKLIEVSNGVSGQAGIFMMSPIPEPPATDPFMSLTATSNGPNINLYTPQMGGTALVNNHPQIKIRCDSTASRMLLQRAFNGIGGPADSTGISMYADSVSSEMRFFKGSNVNLKITTNSSGTSSGYIDDGSEYMGIEPSPWHAGGDLTMYSAAGGPTLVLASNGMISVGTSAHTNIITVQQYSPTDPIADAWTTYSSRRWKINIQPLQGSLAKVMQLQGVSYDQKEGSKHDIGLIAEDVGKVVPEVVAYEDNGVDAKSIDYARLTALLIEAVKEQQKTIDELKSELDGLKAQPNIKALLTSGK
jgi:hypothetical protein